MIELEKSVNNHDELSIRRDLLNKMQSAIGAVLTTRILPINRMTYRWWLHLQVSSGPDDLVDIGPGTVSGLHQPDQVQMYIK